MPLAFYPDLCVHSCVNTFARTHIQTHTMQLAFHLIPFYFPFRFSLCNFYVSRCPTEWKWIKRKRNVGEKVLAIFIIIIIRTFGALTCFTRFGQTKENCLKNEFSVVDLVVTVVVQLFHRIRMNKRWKTNKKKRKKERTHAHSGHSKEISFFFFQCVQW